MALRRRGVTAQQKIISVTDKFGAKGVKKNQGSTIIKYDHLPVDFGVLNPIQEFNFFIDAQTRKFPLTNLTDGKLGVGEAMAIQRLYFTLALLPHAVDTPPTFEWGGSATFDETFGADGSPFDGAVFAIMIANSQVVKPTPVLSARSPFNRMATFYESLATFSGYNVFHFETDVIIPTLLEFQVKFKTPIMDLSGITPAEGAQYFIGCYIEGTGAILAPRSTF